ncbi:MAG: riboflavin biosynthesis protein RibF [Planctomycetales bacterium]|nr:riboflavin biosynthesis protein RibF [Planctomycetales bacterium]
MTQIVWGLDAFPPSLRGGALAIGNFDGVHRGHARLIEQLLNMARSLGGPAIVLTFDPAPRFILAPKLPKQPPLTTVLRRAKLLGQLGVDCTVVCRTTPELLDSSPQAFFQNCAVDAIGVTGMVEGPNFFFGKDRKGDVNLLQELCQAENVQLEVARAECDAGEMIASTRIRAAILAGDLTEANRMLTEDYQIEGAVVPGEQRGRRLGFPTANLAEIESLVPGTGVYAGTGYVASRAYRAAIHVGPNPTFNPDGPPKVEAHLIDFQGQELYGQCIALSFNRKIREVQKFHSIDQLVQQLRMDISICSQQPAFY